MPSESDRLMVQQIRLGDDRAWADLIARYEGRLLAFVERRLHDYETSKDVVQETFIGFFNSLAHFDDNRELQTYLFTIASYKLTDRLRKLGRPAYQAAPLGDNLLDSDPAASSLARSKERKEIESEAVARSLGQLVEVAMQAGDFTKIKVLELLFVKGWPNNEVAKYLGINEQKVANIRFAAVKKLNQTVRDSDLPLDVFPELHLDAEEALR
jgi:RNA polymerase sigma-70 factor (ECF subfamily)